MKLKPFLITFVILATGGVLTLLKMNVSPSNDWKVREARLSELESQLRELTLEIKAAQGHSECDTEEQCQVLGLGTRICGEYKDFLVYSTRDANLNRLLPLVKKFNETHEKLSDLSAAAGSCGVKPIKPHCSGGQCITRGF